MDTNIQPITREVIEQQARHAHALGTLRVNIYRGTEHESVWEAIRARLEAEEVRDSEGSA